MRQEKTTELVLTRGDLERLRRSRGVCGHCGGVFVMEDPEHRVCNHCVQEALEAESFVYTYKPKGEQVMPEYTDQLSLCTDKQITLESHGLTGILSMRVRDFTGKDKYAFFLHIGPTLVETFSGPVAEIHKAHERANEIRQHLGQNVKWLKDE